MKIGQRVKWKSQGGGGHQTEKVGKIVRIITPEICPWKYGLKEFPSHKLMFDGYRLPGGKKTKLAYLVEVIVGQTLKPRLYMPLPTKLRAIRSDAGTNVGLTEKDAQ